MTLPFICSVLLVPVVLVVSAHFLVEALRGKIVTKWTKAPNFAWGFVSM